MNLMRFQVANDAELCMTTATVRSIKMYLHISCFSNNLRTPSWTPWKEKWNKYFKKNFICCWNDFLCIDFCFSCCIIPLMCRVLIAWSNLSWILQAFFCAAFTDITMFSQASVSVSLISGIKGHKAQRHSPQLKLRSRSSPRRSGRPVRNTWCWPSSPNWSPVIHTKGNF